MSSNAVPRHSVSVAAAVTDDRGRLLVLRRCDTGEWEPPGGVLELDESIESGLCREVREETGLEVEPVRLTGVYKNVARAIVALVFRCRLVSGELTTNNEASAFRWVTSEDLHRMVREQDITEAFAVRLLDALDSADSPRIRTHDGVSLVDDQASTAF